MIEGLKEEYDYIIIDIYPVGLVADAYELMKYSDHNFYVMRQNYSYRNQFLLMDEKFQKKEIEHLAFILNGYVSKREIATAILGAYHEF